MPKIATMDGVKNWDFGTESGPVELWEDDDNKRLTAVAYNEGGLCSTSIDLLQLLDWVDHHRDLIKDWPNKTIE